MTPTILACVAVGTGLVGFLAGRRVGRGDLLTRQGSRSSALPDDHEGWERLIGAVHEHDPERCPGCKALMWEEQG